MKRFLLLTLLFLVLSTSSAMAQGFEFYSAAAQGYGNSETPLILIFRLEDTKDRIFINTSTRPGGTTDFTPLLEVYDLDNGGTSFYCSNNSFFEDCFPCNGDDPFCLELENAQQGVYGVVFGTAGPLELSTIEVIDN